MRTHPVYWIGAFLGVCVLSSAAACGSPSQTPREVAGATEKKQESPVPGEVGSPMPAFTLRDVEGREFSSNQLRGKVLLVDFWATWCEPCKVEMPGYQELQNRFAERGLIVVGLALDTNAADVSAFGKKLGVHYPLLLATPEVKEQFALLGIPMTLLVDRQGIIRYKVVGFEYKERVEAALKNLL